MKYKILINSYKPALMKDFFNHTSNYFNNMSTSEINSDILNHIELFHPDAYIMFLDSYDIEQIERTRTVKMQAPVGNTPYFVIIANSETCNALESEEPGIAELLIRRPISPDNLALAIINFLDKEKERKARFEENKKREEEDAARKAELERKKAEEAGRKKHILLVDDDRTVLKMLKTALSEKYDVTAIVNGVVAEKFLMTKECDLVILDYEMPVKTGYEVFKDIRENEKTSDTPVIFLTGLSDSEKIAEIMLLKPNGYLLKPINMEMLMTTIKNNIG